MACPFLDLSKLSCIIEQNLCMQIIVLLQQRNALTFLLSLSLVCFSFSTQMEQRINALSFLKGRQLEMRFFWPLLPIKVGESECKIFCGSIQYIYKNWMIPTFPSFSVFREHAVETPYAMCCFPSSPIFGIPFHLVKTWTVNVDSKCL